jgi:hypothetical protein
MHRFIGPYPFSRIAHHMICRRDRRRPKANRHIFSFLAAGVCCIIDSFRHGKYGGDCVTQG